jgi:hypothetical protein
VHWFLGVSVLLKYPQRWLMNRPAHHGPNYPSARIALAGNAV